MECERRDPRFRAVTTRLCWTTRCILDYRMFASAFAPASAHLDYVADGRRAALVRPLPDLGRRARGRGGRDAPGELRLRAHWRRAGELREQLLALLRARSGGDHRRGGGEDSL